MSLRLKIVLLLSVLAASATAAIGVVSYRTTARELRHTVDDSLQTAADRLLRAPGMRDDDGDGDTMGGNDGDRDARPRGVDLLGPGAALETNQSLAGSPHPFLCAAHAFPRHISSAPCIVSLLLGA